MLPLALCRPRSEFCHFVGLRAMSLRQPDLSNHCLQIPATLPDFFAHILLHNHDRKSKCFWPRLSAPILSSPISTQSHRPTPFSKPTSSLHLHANHPPLQASKLLNIAPFSAPSIVNHIQSDYSSFISTLTSCSSPTFSNPLLLSH